MKKYWFDKPRTPEIADKLPHSLPVGVVLIIPVTECDLSCFCCLLENPRRCQAVDSSPQSSESYSESDGPPPSLSDISTATLLANIVATSV